VRGGRDVFSRTTSNAPHLESAKAIRAVSTFTVLFMVGLHGLVLVSLLGFPVSGFPVHRLAMVLFGLLLVGIGNVLPRVRPNAIVGRTRITASVPAAAIPGRVERRRVTGGVVGAYR
jgi:hypothetical protein